MWGGEYENDPEEKNNWLRDLNNKSYYDYKIIAYYGYIGNDPQVDFYGAMGANSFHEYLILNKLTSLLDPHTALRFLGVLIERIFRGLDTGAPVSFLDNDGSENWTVSELATTQARIRVRSMSNASVADTSDANFTINNGITVLTPNGGETWAVDSTHTIKWSSNGVSGKVKIELSRDEGATWTTLFKNIANNGKRKWTVTEPATTQARIRVSSVNSPGVVDTSNANFIIQ